MTSVPRDPAFWKRFSTAVHLDEESGYGRPELKHSDSWLARQRRKESRRKCVCPICWLLFFVFVAAVIGVVIWLLKSGLLNNVHIGNDNGTPNVPMDPNVNANSKLRMVRAALLELNAAWR
ncbi:hypothetical protein LTR86_010034 [Recurvomyces mirabilis]|nr:hypothetical protein LTR86_010034 [Recurvomyces mirabilis]